VFLKERLETYFRGRTDHLLGKKPRASDQTVMDNPSKGLIEELAKEGRCKIYDIVIDMAALLSKMDSTEMQRKGFTQDTKRNFDDLRMRVSKLHLPERERVVEQAVFKWLHDDANCDRFAKRQSGWMKQPDCDRDAAKFIDVLIHFLKDPPFFNACSTVFVNVALECGKRLPSASPMGTVKTADVSTPIAPNDDGSSGPSRTVKPDDAPTSKPAGVFPPTHPPLAAWTWLPPDPNLPSPRQEEWTHRVDGFPRKEDVPNGGCFISASARGRGHKQDGLYCDDSSSFFHAGCWRVVIASDGAGSAKFSRSGSQVACDSVKKELGHFFKHFMMPELSEHALKLLEAEPGGQDSIKPVLEAFQKGFSAARQGIVDWVKRTNSAGPESPERQYINRCLRGTQAEASRFDTSDSNAPLLVVESDCNSTLLVAASTTVKHRKADGSIHELAMVVSCAIGDGMIAVFRKPQSASKSGSESLATPLMKPDTGQYAGQTEFVSRTTSDPSSVRERFRVGFFGRPEDVVAVVAMTDGIADDYYEKKGLERLYCDLVLNRILELPASSDSVLKEREWAEKKLAQRADEAKISAIKLLKERNDKVEPAEKYRKQLQYKQLKVNASYRVLSSLVKQEQVFGKAESNTKPPTVRILYAGLVLDRLDLTAQELLQRPGLLKALLQQAAPAVTQTTDLPLSERLFRWIDSYIVKGSFDDRTMVAFISGTHP